MVYLLMLFFAKTNKMFQDKYTKLVLGIVFDLLGSATFVIPMVGEFADVIWAPLSAFLLYKMYPNRTGKVAATLGFIEELVPFLDFIPTFTLTWLYTYIWSKSSNSNESTVVEIKSK